MCTLVHLVVDSYNKFQIITSSRTINFINLNRLKISNRQFNLQQRIILFNSHIIQEYILISMLRLLLIFWMILLCLLHLFNYILNLLFRKLMECRQFLKFIVNLKLRIVSWSLWIIKKQKTCTDTHNYYTCSALFCSRVITCLYSVGGLRNPWVVPAYIHVPFHTTYVQSTSPCLRFTKSVTLPSQRILRSLARKRTPPENDTSQNMKTQDSVILHQYSSILHEQSAW